MSAIAHRARAGMVWTALATGGEKFVGFGVQLLLARLLMPEHFGLIGMAVVFTGLIQVASEFGVTAALVQRREKDLREEHLDTAFWTAVVSGTGALLLCVALVGPLAAWFYGEPILWPIVAVISLSVLTRAASSVHRAILTRSLEFRTVGLITLTSVIAGGVAAVLLAIAGFGVWSIAWNGVVTSAAAVPLYWLSVRWRPRLRVSRSAFRDVFGFGAFVTGYDIVMFVGKNVDYLLIGKFVGASALGAYAIAYLITDVFRKSVMNVMNRVMYPIYGQLQDTPERVKRYYLSVIRINTLLVFPLLTLLALFPSQLVTSAFGIGWEDAAFPLRMLAIAMMIHAAGGTSASVMRGLGHAKLQFWVYFTRVVLISIPLVVIGLAVAGMQGVAVAVIFSKAIARMVAQYYMKRLINVSELDVWHAIKPAVAGATIMTGGGLLSHLMLGGPTSPTGLLITSLVLLAPPVVIATFLLRHELLQSFAAVRSIRGLRHVPGTTGAP